MPSIARVAIDAAVNSGAVESRQKLEEDETFQELGKIVDTSVKKLLSECKSAMEKNVVL